MKFPAQTLVSIALALAASGFVISVLMHSVTEVLAVFPA